MRPSDTGRSGRRALGGEVADRCHPRLQCRSRLSDQVLEALARQDPPPTRSSSWTTAPRTRRRPIAATARRPRRHDRPQGIRRRGANRGWSEATSDTVVFLDSDAVPPPGGARCRRARCARIRARLSEGLVRSRRARRGDGSHTFRSRARSFREASLGGLFVSSYCMAVPRALDVRWDESYGGEDALFSADATRPRGPLMFDPRIVAEHHLRVIPSATSADSSSASLTGWPAAGRFSARVCTSASFPLPVHLLPARPAPLIYRRLEPFPELRRRFLGCCHTSCSRSGRSARAPAAMRSGARRSAVRAERTFGDE